MWSGAGWWLVEGGGGLVVEEVMAGVHQLPPCHSTGTLPEAAGGDLEERPRRRRWFGDSPAGS